MEKPKDLKTKLGHTRIDHKVRVKYGLTTNDYSVANVLYHLGGAEKSKQMGGWVYASKEYIADTIGVNKRTVERAIVKLLAKKLIKKHPETKFLMTTTLWYNEDILNRKDKR